MVPPPQDFPSGCRFHPRCSYATVPQCSSESPLLREVIPGHFVRCHFAEEINL
jgi:oligopeptide/dipeptide ABC transporter ATP-binding protein